MKTKKPNDLHVKLAAAPHAWALLGVRRKSPPEDLKAAHRTLAAMLHPDRSPDDPTSAALMARVNVAYDTLRDPARARAHWAELRARSGTQECAPCGGAGETVRQKGFRTQLVTRCLECGGAGFTLKKGETA